MGERLVKELTPQDYPEPTVVLVGRCAVEGCAEQPRRYAGRDQRLAVAFLRGWFERHVLETGHSILIVEPAGDADALRGAGEGSR